VELSDSVVRHLRGVVDLPDLSGTRYELGEELGAAVWAWSIPPTTANLIAESRLR